MSEPVKNDSVKDKSVPAEQVPEEAKEQEPDAVEQAEKLEKKGLDTLPTIT